MTTHNSLKMLSFASVLFVLTSFSAHAAVKKSSHFKVGVSVVSSCSAVGLVRIKNGACVKRA